MQVGRRALREIYMRSRFDRVELARVISNDNNVLEKFRSHGIFSPPRLLSFSPSHTPYSPLLFLSFLPTSAPLVFARTCTHACTWSYTCVRNVREYNDSSEDAARAKFWDENLIYIK